MGAAKVGIKIMSMKVVSMKLNQSADDALLSCPPMQKEG